MKAKKFLKLIQAHCTEENCGLGKCPLAVQNEKYVDCLLCVEYDFKKWDIKAIVKAVKKLKGEKHGK